jgi:hypothetical protein
MSAPSPSLLRLLAATSGTYSTGTAGCPDCDNVHEGDCYVAPPRPDTSVKVAPIFTDKVAVAPVTRELRAPTARVFVTGGRAATILMQAERVLRGVPLGDSAEVGLSECDYGCKFYAVQTGGRPEFYIAHSWTYGCRVPDFTDVVVQTARRVVA